MLATRLSIFLPSLIKEDQVGFVRGREGRDNTAKVLNAIYFAKRFKCSLVLLSTDAEKAFDRVSWDYMREVLIAIKFPVPYINAVFSLYTHASASIIINDTLSPCFNIRNGTRQGCPLSPLLFVLVMETLLQAIRKEKRIEGIRIDQQEHKVAAFADDLLILNTNPAKALPLIYKILEQFSSYSNFKINMSKSHILSMNLPSPIRNLLKANSPFNWDTPYITFIGVKIGPDPSTLFQLKFTPLLQSISDQLVMLKNPMLSWFVRKNIVTSLVFPRLIYLQQVLPIPVPKSYYIKIKRQISLFIWAGRRA